MNLKDRIKKLEVTLPPDSKDPEMICVQGVEPGTLEATTFMVVFTAYRKGGKWIYGKTIPRDDAETESEFMARVEVEHKLFKETGA